MTMSDLFMWALAAVLLIAAFCVKPGDWKG